MRASTAAAGAVIVCLWFTACGGDDEPGPPSGQAREAAAVVQALERSLQRRDYRHICRQLLTSQVREQAGGRECPSQLRRTAADVQRPSIAIRAIRLTGVRARVEVTTRARGEAALPEVIELTRENGRYRISSLGR